MKIKTVKDVVEASNKIIEDLVANKRLTVFNLLVDHGEGTMSNCTWTPTSKVSVGQSFLAVEDYAKIMILLLTHLRIENLEYDKKNHAVTAVFFGGPEIEEANRLENPEEEH